MKISISILLLLIATSVQAENVIIKFYATWCPPCKKIAPVVNAVSNRLNIEVRHIDVDTQTGLALAKKLQIDRVPTLIMLKNGSEVCRVLGAIDENELFERVKKCFKNTRSPINYSGSKNKSPANTSKTQVGNREINSPPLVL